MNRIVQLVDKYSDEIYRNLEDLVNINSFTGNPAGLEAVAEKLCEIGGAHNIVFEKRVVASDPAARPQLLSDNSGGGDFYAFVGHFDTVHPPESEFSRLREEGEKLVGPGVLDMKNGLLIALYSYVVLRELLPGKMIPVKFLFNSDEEIGSPFSREVMKSDLDKARAGFVFEPGRPGNRIVTERKGILSLDIDIAGKPSHSGESPDKGVNAIVRAAELIGKLERLNDFGKGVSVQCNEISGGTARNVIADRCCIGVDIRVPNMAEKELLTKRIDEILTEKTGSEAKISYRMNFKRPPMTKLERSQDLIDGYIKVSEQFGITVTESGAGGVSDGNLLSGLGIPCLDGLGSYGEFPHTMKEYIIKKALTEKIAVFTTFFLKLLEDEKEE